MKRLAVLFVLIAIAGCSQQMASTPQSDANNPVIVRIVSRQSTITARASANGPIYSVNTNQGEQIVPNMTLDQLQAQHPDIARQVRTMNAGASTGAWAGLD